MQMSKALQLRREYGNNPCSHPGFDREFCFGADTGDKVCTTCGRVLSSEEVEEIKRRQEKS